MSNEIQSLSDLEIEVLKLVRDSGNRGVTLLSLQKSLGIDSRRLSRAVSKLVKKGLVKREPIVVDGRKTYRILHSYSLEDLAVSLDLVSRVPCFVCKYLQECSPGGRVSPTTCSLLERWLDELSLSDKA
uniref:MarR family transcriptional regulator n=1 Tax=Fervidicoccus fontis TaxID=683846 RepID=A0A7J3ZKJ4_9CREN